ncbi:hypothetical protein LTS17_009576 [Exophiala oligosperma]
MGISKLFASCLLHTVPVILACAHAYAESTTNLTLTGHITPEEVFSFVYVPFEVDQDVTSIFVNQTYSFQGAGNSLDLGVFDSRGIGAINAEGGRTGSRGWSGGFRFNFTISAEDATPGYDAGPIQAGTWNVALGPYATNRSGIDWKLDISLSRDPKKTLWTPSLAPVYKGSLSSPKWLRGDFHMHTIYSDGKYLPNQQINNAMSRDLDFIFFSDHNTDTSNNNIAKWIPANASELLVCRAIEVTTRHGHWQAIGLEYAQQVEWRYTNASNDTGYADAATQVLNSGALVSINHPFQNCSRCDWTLDWDHNQAIEVWNGRFDPLDEVGVQWWQAELGRGKRITAIGGSDAHSYPDINGLPTTVVRVEGEKSQSAIVQAVKTGRVYLVEGPGQEIDFAVQYGNKTAQIGDVVPKSECGPGIYATFTGVGFAGADACFISEKGYFSNVSIVDGQSIHQPLPNVEFVRVEVRNSSNILLGLTNPVYVV